MKTFDCPARILSILIFAFAQLDGARTQATCVPPPSSLKSWWAGENSNTDEIGTNILTLINGTTFAAGEVGVGFNFDGVDDYIRVPANASTDIGTGIGFTIECWIKPSNLTRSQAIAEWNDSLGSIGVHFWHSDAGLGGLGSLLADVTDTSGALHVFASSPNLLVLNTFQHVALSYDKLTGVGKIYYNGSMVSSANLGTFSPRTSYDLYFGSRVSGPAAVGGFFVGMMDEITIYNRALSDSEIQTIYIAGSAGKCPTNRPPSVIAQPVNQTATFGNAATFTAVVGGSLPLSLQWRFNGIPMANATNTSFTLENTTTNNSGIYALTVTNLYGAAVSSNLALTVNPLTGCTPAPPGLLNWWSGSNNAVDVVGGLTGDLYGGTTLVAGKVGQAFSFDGVNDCVTNTTPGLTNVLDNYTTEFWAWPSAGRASTLETTTGISGNGNQRYAVFPFFQQNGTPAGSGISVGTNGVSVFEFGNNYMPALLVYDTPISGWTHIAVVYSNRRPNLYINGTLVRIGLQSGLSSCPSTWFGERGVASTGQGFYAGLLDEVSIYNRGLSSNEIQSIYNASIVGKCGGPVAPVILSDPKSITSLVGTNITLSTAAGGSVPLSYQWRFNGTNIANATNASLTLTNVKTSQSGAYSVQVTNAGGAVVSASASVSVLFPTAVLRLASSNIMAGQAISLPLTLVANGIENGLGFSLNFNTQRLAFVSATLGNGAVGATMVVNSSMIATGRLGIAVSFPPQLTFNAGTQEVVKVNFNALSLLGNGSANTTTSFADQPVSRELFDQQLQLLPANYSNSIITLAPTVFEGDIFPRPGGNQAITSTDWGQAGRFAARLDLASAGTEFQRADIAPRATLGDGQIKVTDWVQAGRYLAGLDPQVAIGGPTNETIVATINSPVNRQLRLGSTTALQGQNKKVSLTLDAQGDENAVGFTLTFDPVAIAFSNIILGTEASGANMIPNTSQIATGKLGVVLLFPIGTTLAPGPRELVQISLITSSNAAGLFPISLSDQVVTRCISDSLANELPVNYVNGTVSISPPNPTLAITQSRTNITVTWPLWAADFTLQTSATTNGLGGDWTNTSISLLTNGSTVSFTMPTLLESRFFRLYHP